MEDVAQAIDPVSRPSSTSTSASAALSQLPGITALAVSNATDENHLQPEPDEHMNGNGVQANGDVAKDIPQLQQQIRYALLLAQDPGACRVGWKMPASDLAAAGPKAIPFNLQ